MVGFYSLLEVLHALLFVLQARLHHAVAGIVKGFCTAVVVHVGSCEGLGVVHGGFVVFLLSVEARGKIVMPTEVGGVCLKGTTVVQFCLVVFLCLVVSVAFAQQLAVGLGRYVGGQKAE